MPFALRLCRLMFSVSDSYHPSNIIYMKISYICVSVAHTPYTRRYMHIIAAPKGRTDVGERNVNQFVRFCVTWITHFTAAAVVVVALYPRIGPQVILRTKACCTKYDKRSTFSSTAEPWVGCIIYTTIATQFIRSILRSTAVCTVNRCSLLLLRGRTQRHKVTSGAAMEELMEEP